MCIHFLSSSLPWLPLNGSFSYAAHAPFHHVLNQYHIHIDDFCVDAYYNIANNRQVCELHVFKCYTVRLFFFFLLFDITSSLSLPLLSSSSSCKYTFAHIHTLFLPIYLSFSVCLGIYYAIWCCSSSSHMPTELLTPIGFVRAVDANFLFFFTFFCSTQICAFLRFCYCYVSFGWRCFLSKSVSVRACICWNHRRETKNNSNKNMM